ncbi:hypothetical protein A9Q73_09610 [Bermanella sp. 47_1433_sub80_T6]|nr:hypothetical protein A9Q73_09610 [Bermanella sp. 47_1433_sub80_T6]
MAANLAVKGVKFKTNTWEASGRGCPRTIEPWMALMRAPTVGALGDAWSNCPGHPVADYRSSIWNPA